MIHDSWLHETSPAGTASRTLETMVPKTPLFRNVRHIPLNTAHIAMTEKRKILESGDGGFVLSTHRVRRTVESWGFSEHTSIPIDAVTSCEIEYESNPLFFVGAVVSLAVMGWGAYVHKGGVALGGVISAAVLTALYFRSRKRVLSVSSPSASINLRLENIPFDEAVEVIDTIEEIRQERLSKIPS